MPVYADLILYDFDLSGANVSPPNASTGTGTGRITFDTALSTMRVQATFSGLSGNVNSAGIHGATAIPGTGTAQRITPALVLPGFPLGVTSGAYDQTFNMLSSSSYSNSFLNANFSTPSIAFNSFLAAAAENRTYFNINTTAFGGGEVRGFLTATAVPEPSSLIALAIGGMGVLFTRRKRKFVA